MATILCLFGFIYFGTQTTGQNTKIPPVLISVTKILYNMQDLRYFGFQFSQDSRAFYSGSIRDRSSAVRKNTVYYKYSSETGKHLETFNLPCFEDGSFLLDKTERFIYSKCINTKFVPYISKKDHLGSFDRKENKIRWLKDFEFPYDGGNLGALHLSSDGRYIIGTWGFILDSATGEQIRNFHSVNTNGNELYFDFAPNSQIFAVNQFFEGENYVSIFSINTGKVIKNISNYGMTYNQFDFSPDSQTIATYSKFTRKSITSPQEYNKVTFWSTQTGLQTDFITDPCPVQVRVEYHPSGKYLYTFCPMPDKEDTPNNIIRLWNLKTKKSLVVAKDLLHGFTPIYAISPDGKRLMYATGDPKNQKYFLKIIVVDVLP